MQLRNNLAVFSPDEQTLKKKKKAFQNSLPSKLAPIPSVECSRILVIRDNLGLILFVCLCL